MHSNVHSWNDRKSAFAGPLPVPPAFICSTTTTPPGLSESFTRRRNAAFSISARVYVITMRSHCSRNFLEREGCWYLEAFRYLKGRSRVISLAVSIRDLLGAAGGQAYLLGQHRSPTAGEFPPGRLLLPGDLWVSIPPHELGRGGDRLQARPPLEVSPTLSVCLASAFFARNSAHHFLVAPAMRFRPAALNLRFFRAGCTRHGFGDRGRGVARYERQRIVSTRPTTNA